MRAAPDRAPSLGRGPSGHQAPDNRGGREGHRRAPAQQRGAGLFSTIFGFTVFLFFVLFATQVMVALYARSTITAVAYDAARRVASGTPEADAGSRAAAQMGRRCPPGRCSFDWSRSDADDIVLDVDVPPGPSLIPAIVRQPMGIDHVRRTFVVRREVRVR